MLKNLIRSIMAKTLISWYAISGPPRILHYGSYINVEILKAFGANVSDNVEGILPPITIHGPKGCYKNLSIADKCLLNGNNFLDLNGRITLEEGVSLGPGVIIVSHNAYNRNEYLESRLSHTVGVREVLIKKGAGIKAGALVTMGVVVGKNAVVAGNAVVNRDVPANCLVAGVPAKVINEIK
jgi:acetyltransferase-like isoleucine patch superfamily enzyme